MRGLNWANLEGTWHELAVKKTLELRSASQHRLSIDRNELENNMIFFFIFDRSWLFFIYSKEDNFLIEHFMFLNLNFKLTYTQKESMTGKNLAVKHAQKI